MSKVNQITWCKVRPLIASSLGPPIDFLLASGLCSILDILELMMTNVNFNFAICIYFMAGDFTIFNFIIISM